MNPIERRLVSDGWREGRDELWRNDRFGGAYKLENAVARLMSKRGEPTDRAEYEARFDHNEWTRAWREAQPKVAA